MQAVSSRVISTFRTCVPSLQSLNKFGSTNAALRLTHILHSNKHLGGYFKTLFYVYLCYRYRKAHGRLQSVD